MRQGRPHVGTKALAGVATLAALSACRPDWAGAYAATAYQARYGFAEDTPCPLDQVTATARAAPPGYDTSNGAGLYQYVQVVRGCGKQRVYACHAEPWGPDFRPWCDNGTEEPFSPSPPPPAPQRPPP